MVPTTDHVRERRSGRAREEILLAAARAIARTGYAQITMGEIAEEAGYSVPSLYAYFAGKDQIVEELGAMLGAEVLAVFDEGFPKGLTTYHRVELLLRRLFAMTDRRRDLLTVFISLPVGGRSSAATRESGYEMMRLRIARWFRENERVGKGAAEEMAVALLALCDGFLKRSMHSGSRALFVQLAPRVAAQFLYGARPALEGRRSGR